MFQVNDVVVFKNANKYGALEYKITKIIYNDLVELDNHIQVPITLIVLS